MRNEKVSISQELKNDPTFENYIALFQVITADSIEKNGRMNLKRYLSGLFDEVEAEKRMAEIDYLREIGADTQVSHEVWLENYKKKIKSNREYKGARKVKVTNPHAGTVEIFPSINQMCQEYNFHHRNVRTLFNYHKSDKIQYKGLILEKI